LQQSYERIGLKFLQQVKDEWTVKGIVEKSAVLGDEPFLIYARTGETYSYGETDNVANRICNSLIRMGLNKGDRVGIYLTNRPEYVLTLFTLAKGGLIEVPVNTNFKTAEITYMVNKAEISTLIVESTSEFNEIVSKVADGAPCLKNVIFLGEVPDSLQNRIKVYSLDEMMNSENASTPEVRVKDSDIFSIIFTSGTTGLPKGAISSNKSIVLAALSIGAVPINKASRNYTCLPLFHTNAQVYSAIGMRCLGASLVLSEKFSPKNFWKEIIEHQATFFNSIGGMMQILDSVYSEEDVPDHPAKAVFVGGTPAALWERFEQKFRVDVYEGYAMSEAPVLFMNNDPGQKQDKVGSFGKPIFADLGRHIKVVDDQGRDIRVGIGELLQKGGDFVTEGYWNAPEANQEAFDADGWFHSGDVVRVDEDGYFYFVDRNKFMIRVGGENVSAFEVEDVVNSHAAVAQSAAIPVSDPFKGEEIKVLVKLVDPGKGLDFKDIVLHCADRLAYFKVPRYLEVVDDFPKTATERIQKIQLKELERTRESHGWDRNKEYSDWRDRCR